jgi:hypothetical protein
MLSSAESSDFRWSKSDEFVDAGVLLPLLSIFFLNIPKRDVDRSIGVEGELGFVGEELAREMAVARLSCKDLGRPLAPLPMAATSAFKVSNFDTHESRSIFVGS